MDFFSFWPFLGCLLVAFWVVSTPPFRLADTPPTFQTRRMLTMDGLRGFLALAVLFHHIAIYHLYLIDGEWKDSPSRPFTMLGPAGVSMFFMITGYLFWSKLTKEDGRPRWLPLYIGRLFRIVPLYLVAVGTMVLLEFARDHFHLREPGSKVFHELVRWFAGGVLGLTGLNTNPKVAEWLAGVTWSIQWEWFFYLSLPLLALFARSKQLRLPLLGFVVVACMVDKSRQTGQEAVNNGFVIAPTVWEIMVLQFALGMLCATLHERGIRPKLPDWVTSLLVVLFLALTIFYSPSYSTRSCLLLGLSFFLITSGTTIFGLLISRPARRMGDVSYGIYLLQGLVLALVFRPAPMRSFALASPAHWWLCALLSTVLLLVVSTLAHVLIERPGVALGRRVAAHLEPSAGLPIRS